MAVPQHVREQRGKQVRAALGFAAAAAGEVLKTPKGVTGWRAKRQGTGPCRRAQTLGMAN